MLVIIYMMILGRKTLLLLSLILLFGCKEDNFQDFAKNMEDSVKTVVHDINNYNFKDAFYNIKTAYLIANKSRYSEDQVINVETSRNTQVAGFQSIINECQTFNCNVLEKTLTKNLLFPENIIGKIELDIPVEKAPDFVNAIGKYGNIVKNSYKKEEYIERDLTLFYDALIPLRAALLKVNELLQKTEVYSFERLNEMQDYAEELNKKITFLENDIKYLNSLKGKRHISIRIERGYNSTFGFVKSRIQNACLFVIEYIHIVILFASIYLIIFFTKKFFSFLKIKIKEEKRKREALKLYNKQEYKIPPQF